jgi:hypothetical protein
MRNFYVSLLGAGVVATGLLAAPPAAHAANCFQFCTKFMSIPIWKKEGNQIVITGWKTICSSYKKICLPLPIDTKTIVIPPHPDPGPLMFKQAPSRLQR